MSKFTILFSYYGFGDYDDFDLPLESYTDEFDGEFFKGAWNFIGSFPHSLQSITMSSL